MVKMEKNLWRSIFIVCMALHVVQPYITNMYPKKYKCEADPEVAINPVCEMKILSRLERRVRLGTTFLKPTKRVFLSVDSEIKTSSNIFMPGFFKTTQDYCCLTDRSSPNAAFIINVLEKFTPEVYKKMNLFIRPCPLHDTVMYELIRFINATVVQNLIPPGEYRTTWRFYNEKNQTYFNFEGTYVFRDKSRQS